MEEFLAVALSFPTVAFTIPLALACLYWVTVIIGLADIDLLGGAEQAADALAGKAEGIVDALAAKAGAVEAAAGKLESIGDAVTASADAAEGAVDGGALATLLSALRLRRAPVTVSLSVLFLVGWLTTFFAARYLSPLLPLPSWLAGVVCLGIGFVVAWPTTALLTFPMGSVYEMRHGVRRVDLVGRVVTITTSRVDAAFGEGELADGGAGLLLQVRSQAPNALKRGDEALLISWHAENETYDVEPMTSVLDERADPS